MTKQKKAETELPYEISTDDAVKLIYNFVTRKELRSIATTEAIGGTITKEELQSVVKEHWREKHKGAMAWICRNNYSPRIEGFPPLFLAFERGEYDLHAVPDIPQNPELIYPTKVFNFDYTGDTVTEAGVKEWLLAHQIGTAGAEKISKVETLGFLNRMPLDSWARPFNNHACSFFETKSSPAMRDFLETPRLEHVRYYFGYEDTDKAHILSNRIRLIFIGVDGSGRNMRPDDATLSILAYSMLQNSWPPPPPY